MAKSNGIFFRLCKYIDSHVLKLLYFTLILPYIMYGIEVWGSTFGYIMNRVLVCQKRAVRSIFKLPYDAHTSVFFKVINSLRVGDLHKYQLALSVFKTLYMGQNRNFAISLTRGISNHDHNTRRNLNFILPRYRRSRSQHSILYQAIKFWNKLPQDLYTNKSLSVFRQKLRTFLLTSY